MEQKHFKKAVKMILQAGVHLFGVRCLQQLKCDTDPCHSQETRGHTRAVLMSRTSYPA